MTLSKSVKDKIAAGIILTEAQKQIIIDCKKRVASIIVGLKSLEKHVKKTKRSRAAIRTMEDFVKCNLSSPSIMSKYEAVIHLLEAYANVKDKG